MLQSPDTLATASVSAERGIVVSRTDTVKVGGSRTVTELLLQSPGMTVSDNGGLAGLKTLNLRGLGSTNTSILVDGVRVGNVQSGQPDLGMFCLDNFKGVVIDYAQNSVSFLTSRPSFTDGAVSGRFGCEAGSFSTFLPSGRLDFRLSDRLSLSATAAGTFSEGDYEYSDGIRRQNNDITRLGGGIDLFGLMDRGDWMAKVWYNGSDRGTPGSVSWPSTDRQHDRNYLVQGTLRKTVSRTYSLTLSAKASRDDVLYQSSYGDSDYSQKEFQLNSTHRFRVVRWLDLCAAEELQLDDLESAFYDALRFSTRVTGGAEFRFGPLKADLTCEYAGTSDRDALSSNVVSPALDFRLKAMETLDIVGFVRRAYRTPTFNELYYPGYGNPELKPEDAFLSDLGLDWRKKLSQSWSLKAKTDIWFNRLSDKITSAPSKEDPSLWMPFNIDVVNAFGMDAEAGAGYSSGDLRTSIDARYSFNKADGVPYLSKHTLVVAADVSLKSWSLDAVMNSRSGRRDSYGDMPDWNTLDMFLSKSFEIRNAAFLVIKASFRNIFDNRYELVTDYPMQGRNFLFGAEIKF